MALQQGHDRVVATLLERDTRSRGGLPALHVAARKDDVNAANLLLMSPDANVNHQSQVGSFPHPLYPSLFDNKLCEVVWYSDALTFQWAQQLSYNQPGEKSTFFGSFFVEA